MAELLDPHLRPACEQVFNFLTPFISRLEEYRWDGLDEDQYAEFLKRAVLIRQYEALDTILKMAAADIGHFGVTLLRPAYEELLWIEYMNQNEKIEPKLVFLLAIREIIEGIKAQEKFLGAEEMSRLGFPREFVKRFASAKHPLLTRLKEIGRRLGWKRRRDESLPSVYFIAEKVGRKQEYNFLYHATSRYVHFSPVELLRRVWGRQGQVTITSKHFAAHWQDFALYWGTRIFVETVIASGDDVVPLSEIDDGQSDVFRNMLKNLCPVPMITPSELESWPDSGPKDSSPG